jgi:cytochrome c peroxidase
VRRWAIIAGLWLVLTGCDGEAPSVESDLAADAEAASTPAALAGEPIEPIPLPSELDPRKVELGRRLFHEPLLSRDGTLSCASCHDLANGGADTRRFSVGAGGTVTQRNTPTVFNASLHFRHFWDGRADNLPDLIDQVITSRREMATNWSEVQGNLQRQESYVAAFAELYPDGIEPGAIKDALVSFLDSLVTPGSPFDRYLAGDQEALADDALAGYELFKSYGCASCHQGVAVGGNMFQELGVMGDYFGDRGDVSEADYGRFNVTGEEKDRFVFKVPSLRNVELTAPYFHDGAAADLAEAVQLMARYQLGRRLTSVEVRYLTAFLRSLTGTYEGRPLSAAARPAAASTAPAGP